MQGIAKNGLSAHRLFASSGFALADQTFFVQYSCFASMFCVGIFYP